MIISIPMPPSTNKLWRAVGRGNVIRSQAYRRWLRECDGYCLANGWHKTPISGPYEISMTFDRNACGQGADLGNREKPVSDWLQHAGIIQDDKLAQRIELKWAATESGCRIEVTAAGATHETQLSGNAQITGAKSANGLE